MKLRNTNPIGEVDLPLIRRSLQPGETFEVPDEAGARLLEQVGNFELADGEPDPEPGPEIGPADEEDDR